MGKPEQLPNGESVGYAPVGNIGRYAQKHLDKIKSIDFTHEKNKAFNDYANEITEVWVAHVFREGNTRTIAAFMEQNLVSKGIEMDMVILNKQHDLRDYFVRSYDGDTKLLAQAFTLAHKDKI